MAKRTILAVGVGIPGTVVDYTDLESRLSLLDYDIAVFDPNISEFLYGAEEYQGKPSLSDSATCTWKEHTEHWRREILEAVRAGKTIIILLNEQQDVYVATGERTYSGTGRNRRSIRTVVLRTNYSILPAPIDVTNAQGSSMRLNRPDNVLATYWSEFSNDSQYRVLLGRSGVIPLVVTRTGERIVGGFSRYHDAKGHLLYLPYIDFRSEAFRTWDEDKEEMCWTKGAIAFGKRFVSAICCVDEAIRHSGKITPTPKWVKQDKYSLPKENKARSRLLATESKIESLQQQIEKYKETISKESILKDLLFEKGKPLEESVIEALKLMGFAASQYRDNESEFDAVFECKEGRFLGEAEGKDNKAINIDKLRQLDMNIHEDFDREEVEDMAKGVLFGNAHRLSAPEEREEFFTQKCLTAANRSKTALIRTTDLFDVAMYLSTRKDQSFAKKCRKAIFYATGIVEFPKVPTKTMPPTKMAVKKSK